MSGGSYCYFHSRAPDQIDRIASDLDGMATDCVRAAEYGAELVHWRTKEKLDTAALREAAERLQKLSALARDLSHALDDLGGVTRAVEWWQSGDWDEFSVVDAWRDAKKPETAAAPEKDEGKR